MPTSVGPNTFGEENLVFGYDTGDTANSYKGEPTTNHAVTVIASNNTTVADETTTLLDGTTGIVKQVTISGNNTYTRVRLTHSGLPNSGIPQSGQQFTISHWIRRVGAVRVGSGWEPEVGQSDSYQRPTSESGYSGNTATTQPQEVSTEWQYVTYTYSWNADKSSSQLTLLYFGGPPGVSGADGGIVQIYNPQLEVKPHATPFVNGTRSATQGLIDLTGNSTLDLTNVSFDSNAQMEFDGTDDVLPIDGTGDLNFGVTSSFSIETVFKINSIPSTGNTSGIVCKTHCVGIDFYFPQSGTQLRVGIRNSTDGQQSHGSNQNLSTGEYYHAVFTYTPNQTSGIKLYINGVLDKTADNSGYSEFADPTKNFEIAQGALGGTDVNSDITVPLVKMYNRALTASEIKANYNAIKGRFNI